MSRFLYRLGFGAAAHPWRTICAWILLAAVLVATAATFGGTPQDDYDVPGAKAQAGVEMLREHAPAVAGASAQVLVHDPAGGAVPEPVLTRLHDELSALDHVSTVTLPGCRPTPTPRWST